MRLALFIFALFVVGISAKSKPDKLEELLKKTKEIEDNNKKELAEEAAIDEDDKIDESTVLPPPAPEDNPCNTHHCSWGKECILNKKNEPRCHCTKKCSNIKSEDMDASYVCSSHNETFDSICDLYRQRCLCKSGEEGCNKDSNAKAHLEYMGKCKKLEECTEDMMVQFPERMADWLFQVMKDLNHKEKLGKTDWEVMANQAESDDAVRHIYPVIWKYCDLDSTPHDNHVSHHELIPLIAPVMPMESCIKPFLNKCDKDDDRKITLKEWGMCLGLKEDQIIEKC